MCALVTGVQTCALPIWWRKRQTLPSCPLSPGRPMNGAVKRATKRRLPTLAERPKFSRKSLPWLLVPALAIAAAATWFALDPGFRNSGSAQMTAASDEPDEFGRRVREIGRAHV